MYAEEEDDPSQERDERFSEEEEDEENNSFQRNNDEDPIIGKTNFIVVVYDKKKFHMTHQVPLTVSWQPLGQNMHYDLISPQKPGDLEFYLCVLGGGTKANGDTITEIRNVIKMFRPQYQIFIYIEMEPDEILTGPSLGLALSMALLGKKNADLGIVYTGEALFTADGNIVLGPIGEFDKKVEFIQQQQRLKLICPGSEKLIKDYIEILNNSRYATMKNWIQGHGLIHHINSYSIFLVDTIAEAALISEQLNVENR